ncbi:uncharacterized protein LOC101856796, partial [Aplysia californica]|uniref:Uncharacterized protein LOC101856796 n=1 Tax=Aplysia californica TaxID=6500 RepID=A0ABM1VR27_APLCA
MGSKLSGTERTTEFMESFEAQPPFSCPESSDDDFLEGTIGVGNTPKDSGIELNSLKIEDPGYTVSGNPQHSPAVGASAAGTSSNGSRSRTTGSKEGQGQGEGAAYQYAQESSSDSEDEVLKHYQATVGRANSIKSAKSAKSGKGRSGSEAA